MLLGNGNLHTTHKYNLFNPAVELINDGFYSFDKNTAEWTHHPTALTLPPGFRGRAASSAVVIDGVCYITGGAVAVDGQHLTRLTDSTWIFTPELGIQELVPEGVLGSMPGRYGAYVIDYDGDIISIGGAEQPDKLYDDLWKLDLTGVGAPKWTQLLNETAVYDRSSSSSLPVFTEKRHSGLTLRFEDEIYACLGADSVRITTSSCTVYNLTRVINEDDEYGRVIRWTSVDGSPEDHRIISPTGRAYVGAARVPHSDLVYVFGGDARVLQYLPNDLYVFDPSRKNQIITEYSTDWWPHTRRNHASCVYNSTAFIVYAGKSTASRRHNDIWLFDTVWRRWELLLPDVNFYGVGIDAHYPLSRDEACCVVIDDTVVMMYGDIPLRSNDEEQSIFLFHVSNRTLEPLAFPGLHETWGHWCTIDRENRGVYSVGGYDTRDTNGQILHFDLYSRSVRTLPQPKPRPFRSVNCFGVLWRDYLVNIGGESQPWIYNLDRESGWEPYPLHSAQVTDILSAGSFDDQSITMISQDEALIYVFDLLGIIDFKRQTIAPLEYKSEAFPDGVQMLLGRDRSYFTLMPADRKAYLFGGYGGNLDTTTSYLSDMWAIDTSSLRYCNRYTKLRSSKETPVVGVVDGSWTNLYQPDTDCLFDVGDEDGFFTFTLSMVDLGAGDFLSISEVEDGQPDSSAVLLRNFSGPVSIDRTQSRASIFSYQGKPGQHLLVRFVSDDDPHTVGDGFYASLPHRCNATTYGNALLGRCMPCSPGTSGDRAGMSHCIPCELGTYQTNFSSSTCSPCPPGYNTRSSTECVPCAPGTFSDRDANPTCSLCNEISFNPFEGQSGCIFCPNNSWTSYVGSEADRCKCQYGFFDSLDKDELICASCPQGADCLGGDNRPSSQFGYYGVLVKSGGVFQPEFLKCSPEESCTGGNLCAEGYEGNLCHTCKKSYARLDKECVKCPSDLVSAALFLLVFLTVTAVLSTLIYVYIVKRPHHVMGTISIIVDWVNILFLISKFDISYPTLSKNILTAGAVFNLDSSFISTACFFKTGYFSSWVIRLLSPFFVFAYGAFLLMCLYAYQYRSGKLRKKFARGSGFMKNVRFWLMEEDRDNIIGLSNFLLHTLFAFVSSVVLEYVACTALEDSSNSYYLNASPNVMCFESDWHQHMVIFIVAIIIYVVGIPLVLCRQILGEQRRTHPFSYNTRLRILVKPFKDDFYWWNVVLTLRKLLLSIVAAVLFAEFGVSVVILFTLLTVTLMLEALFQPYRIGWVNIASLAASTAVLLILLLGLFYFSTLTNEISDDSEVAISIIITVMVVTTLISSVLFAFFELRELRRSRSAKQSQPAKKNTSSPSLVPFYRTSSYASSLSRKSSKNVMILRDPKDKDPAQPPTPVDDTEVEMETRHKSPSHSASVKPVPLPGDLHRVPSTDTVISTGSWMEESKYDEKPTFPRSISDDSNISASNVKTSFARSFSGLTLPAAARGEDPTSVNVCSPRQEKSKSGGSSSDHSSGLTPTTSSPPERTRRKSDIEPLPSLPGMSEESAPRDVPAGPLDPCELTGLPRISEDNVFYNDHQIKLLQSAIIAKRSQIERLRSLP